MARKVENSKPNTKKKAPAGKPRASSASKSQQERALSPTYKRRRAPGMSNEITTLLIIAFGIIVCFGMYTGLIGTLGKWIKVAFRSSFGALAYILPPVIIAVGIHTARTKRIGRFGAKYWLALMLMTSLSALWHSFVFNNYKIYSTSEIAVNYVGGGFLGAIVATPLCNFMGQVGSVILLLTMAVILATIIFDISLVQVGQNLTALFAKIKERTMNDYYEEDYEYQEPIEPTFKFDEPTLLPPKEGKKLKIKVRDKDNTKPVDNADAPKRNSVTAEIRPTIFNYDKEVNDDDALPQPVASVLPLKTYAKVVPNSELGGQAVPSLPKLESTTSDVAKLNDLDSLKNNEPDVGNTEATDEAPPEYILPPLSLLDAPGEKNSLKHQEVLENTARKLLDTLASFGVATTITDYAMGPTVTRYELQPQAGVKISKIVGLADDIALNLAASGVRIEAPIPGKAAIGIEIPNQDSDVVRISEIIGTPDFQNAPSRLSFGLGSDISGAPVVIDIARMPHLLIAGSTGSGKSVCINTLITSLLFKSLPSEVKLIMIDPKMVELGGYNGVPHLLIPVVTDPNKAAGALAWSVKEMTQRYKTFAQNNVRDLKGYNNLMDISGGEKMPQVVIIIDELADLMMVAPNDVEDAICRLAQMARAAGMHLVIATQRPSVDVITGIIKANIPSRISFAVSSQVDSRTILDMAGAEKLIGRGDMLYAPIGSNKPIRVQGAFVSDKEVSELVEYAKKFSEAKYDEDVAEQVNSFEISGSKGGSFDSDNSSAADDLLPQAIEMALESNQASVAMYQRRLKVGYQRAARLIDQMEARGIIGPFEGTKPRQILITRQQYLEMVNNGL